MPSPAPASEQLILQVPRVPPAWKREAGLPSPRRGGGWGSRVSGPLGQHRAGRLQPLQPTPPPVLLENRLWFPSALGHEQSDQVLGQSSPEREPDPPGLPLFLQNEESHVTQYAERGWSKGCRDPGEGGTRVKAGVGGHAGRPRGKAGSGQARVGTETGMDQLVSTLGGGPHGDWSQASSCPRACPQFANQHLSEAARTLSASTQDLGPR